MAGVDEGRACPACGRDTEVVITDGDLRIRVDPGHHPDGTVHIRQRPDGAPPTPPGSARFGNDVRALVGDTTAWKALRTVAAVACDAEDARTLIGALGLTGALWAYESAPPSQVQPPDPSPDDAEPSGPLPCDVCGLPVSAAYIARTGRTRHANHPEGA